MDLGDEKMNATISRVEAPVGTLTLFSVDGKLVALGFGDEDLSWRTSARFGRLEWRERDGAPARAMRRYLDGELEALDALEVDPGGTPFQREVWAALRRIPAGTTVSYGELARAVGNPRAVRAVGRANALNPIALVIPCHRVIGADGTLTGYAGGLPRKKWLLEHESRQLSL
jgi:methylated-DNA-[protein]-cysteine S-methyltransferase